MSEQPAPEPARSGLGINLRILSVIIFNFASFLTIGLPLAVLPGYVHDVMGFSPFWAGLVISLQYFATLLSRPHAGRYADQWGPKRIVVLGLCGCFLSGSCYLLAVVFSSMPSVSLALLCVGRLILGVGQSFTGTGAALWGVGVAGSLHIGRIISWNGVMSYGAMAIGAPLGVVIYQQGGLLLLAGIIIVIALLAVLGALPRQAVAGSKGKLLPFRTVLGKIWRYGVILSLGTVGFGVIATFITLFYQFEHWAGGAYALALFSGAFVFTRLLFPNAIQRHGGMKVALICFGVETVGLLMVGFAGAPWMANLGALLTGIGFSLVFPAIGVVAVRQVPPQNQGSALATYTAFMDLSLGLTGPLAGLVISLAGIPAIYLLSGLLVFIALLLTVRLKRLTLPAAT